jgi:hypothetical protein
VLDWQSSEMKLVIDSPNITRTAIPMQNVTESQSVAHPPNLIRVDEISADINGRIIV